VYREFIEGASSSLPPAGRNQSVKGRQRAQSIPKEPSQTTGERLAAHLGDALASLGDRAVLNTNPLSRTEYVQRLASEKYADKIMARGLALRHVIVDCIEKLCGAEGETRTSQTGRRLGKEFCLLCPQLSHRCIDARSRM
jgi:hypothetical protein